MQPLHLAFYVLHLQKSPIVIMQGMDIHNVEAVIVNGPPDTLAQLYQVITYIL